MLFYHLFKTSPSKSIKKQNHFVRIRKIVLLGTRSKVMKTIAVIVLSLSINVLSAHGQPKTQDPAFEVALQSLLTHKVPPISVKEFKKMLGNETVYILDAREQPEFDVSHIKGAKLIGHNQLNKNALNGIPKNATIVVYCTVGVRSEQVGERLLKMGYTNVHNLLGSIIEWVNQNNQVIDSSGAPTKKVHIYSNEYSKWLTSGQVVGK